VDLAVVVIPAGMVPNVLRQCGDKGISNKNVVSGGFSETGKEGLEMISFRNKHVDGIEKQYADKWVQMRHWAELLREYGIRLPEQTVAESLNEAIAASEKIGFPVVMKLVSEKHSHKSEIGGVKVGLQNESDVKKAWNEITSSAKQHSTVQR